MAGGGSFRAAGCSPCYSSLWETLSIGKWALPTKRAFWVVDIYRCRLSFVSPSL